MVTATGRTLRTTVENVDHRLAPWLGSCLASAKGPFNVSVWVFHASFDSGLASARPAAQCEGPPAAVSESPRG
jgi:hypothetical protein